MLRPVMDDNDLELQTFRARRRDELLSAATARTAAGSIPVSITVLSTPDFDEFLRTNDRAVVDVWAPWCGPCRAMEPMLEALARELGPEVRFGKLNADEEPALAGRWNVEAIPTVLVFYRGRLVDRITGALPQDELGPRLRSVYRLGTRADPGE